MSGTSRLTRYLAGASIFFGSFLLFLVQPMIGNLMLPQFGGSSAVWVTCLCSFQVLLVFGYAYAHFLCGRFRILVHIVLLFVSAAAFVPAVRPATCLADSLGAAHPILGALLFLAFTAALPYVLVGANASLIQSLVARDRGGYRLYSLSSVGSFAALLGYPLLVETTLPLGDQLCIYAGCLAVYAAFLAALILLVGRSPCAERRMPLVAAFRNAATPEGAVSCWAYFSRVAIPFELNDSVQTEIDLDAVADYPAMTDDFHPLVGYVRFLKEGRYGVE